MCLSFLLKDTFGAREIGREKSHYSLSLQRQALVEEEKEFLASKQLNYSENSAKTVITLSVQTYLQTTHTGATLIMFDRMDNCYLS